MKKIVAIILVCILFFCNILFENVNQYIEEKNIDDQHIFAYNEIKDPVSDSGEIDNSWPMFGHNPKHTGYSSSIAPETNNVLWSFSADQSLGYVYSSPAVVDGKVYIGANDKKLYCLGANNGTELWNYITGGNVQSSPAVYNGKVYVGSTDNKVYCLNALNGEFIWEYQTGDSVAYSPTVYNGKIYIGSSDNNIYCLNAENGSKIWNFTTGGSITNSPAVANGKAYIGSYDKKLYCLDAENGTYIWEFLTTGFGIKSSPAVANGKVYIGAEISNNKAFCLDANTGIEIWNSTMRSTADTSPAIADGKIYIGSFRTVYCFNAENGTEIWNYTTEDMVKSSPAIADGKVYIGSDDQHVYCLNAGNGNKIWNYTTGYMVRSSPAIADGYVYIGSLDKKVYCFGNNPPETPDAPDGLTTGEPGVEYAYTTNKVSDPDGDSILYLFDWDDGTDSGWIVPSLLGSSIEASHTWTEEREYYIRVKAKDVYDFESDWSSTLSITIRTPSPRLLISCQLSVMENEEFTVNVTSDGTPIENVNVAFGNETETTDVSGKVTFTAPEVIKHTEYIITATLDGYIEDTAKITVLNQREEIGFVYGIVSDLNGPLVDVIIELTAAGKSWVTYTDSEGRYLLTAPPGEYIIEVKKEGYESKTDDVTIIANAADNFNFVLQKSTTPVSSEEVDKQVIQAYLKTHIKNEKIVGQITEEKDDYSIEIYNDLYDITLQSTTEPKDLVKIKVEGEGSPPKIFVFQLNNPIDDVTVQIDNNMLLQKTTDLTKFFSPDNSNEEYMILTLEKSTYVFVQVKEFSEHTITISTIIETVAYTLTILLYIVIAVVAIIVFLGRFYLRPVYLTFSRKKK